MSWRDRWGRLNRLIGRRAITASAGHSRTQPDVNAADSSVRKALEHVPRECFLPEHLQDSADRDAPLRIGHGQTNSQPSTVAAMLTLLEVHPGQKVLDVGAGSGWTTALTGELVGESGSVIGVERVPELAASAREAVRAQGRHWVQVLDAVPGELGMPSRAPFDRILVSAMADHLPHALVEQLAVDGVMVIPVGGEMLRVQRAGEGNRVTRHGWYRFVPLVEG